MPSVQLTPLPIDSVLPQLLETLGGSNAAVLEAPPGAGKTTRVPPALLAAGLAGEGRVVVLEPRRVAARAAARRVAYEQSWALGEEVGYQVRFERRAGAATRLLFVTEGILVQRLQADPFLDGIGAVVFDEIHERGLNADLALAMARKVQRDVRPELKLLAMSATLDSSLLANYFGDSDQPAPVIRSQGRLFPVSVHYDPRPDERPLAGRVATGVRRALSESEGDILVFLPGVGEIRAAEKMLAELARENNLALLPLYGDLPAAAQDRVLKPLGQRKVVLATNVAETSLTIDGLSTVVDSGLARVLRYDPGCGLDRLELGRIHQASAEQRAGRAGRQGPGLCLRLWTEHGQRSLPQRGQAEIHRVDLAGATLQLLAWGETDLDRFGWIEPPAPTRLRRAQHLLRHLGALDYTGVTPLGRTLARLPLHPRLGRLLIEGHQLGQAPFVALAAALLSERDPFSHAAPLGGERRSPPPSRCDLLHKLDLLQQFDRHRHADGGLLAGPARQILRVRDQLLRLTRRLTVEQPAERLDGEEALLRALLTAYPDRLAKRREPGSDRGVMVGGRGVRLARESSVREAVLFVCVQMNAGRRGERAEGLVRSASAVDPAWLRAEELTTEERVEFDPDRQRVVGWRRTRFQDLIIDQTSQPIHDPEAAGVALAEAASSQLERALALDDPATAAFLERVRCLADWLPALELPQFDDAQLKALLPTLCAGKRSFAELRRLPLIDILRGSLSHAQREALDRQAPERYRLPTGHQARIDYRRGEPPLLAARIQELFGLTETPRLAGGRVPLLLHLLAPNRRPQQVTDDLASFWQNTYPQVRKELRGRYPKHAWPEDPLTAQPESRPRRRR